MKFKRNIEMEAGLGKIIIIPAINVIFLLFLFLTFSSSLVAYSGINVKLPARVTSDLINKKNLTITLTGEDVTYLNNKIVTIEELGKTLKTIKDKNQMILIKADRRASVGRIVDIWDI